MTRIATENDEHGIGLEDSIRRCEELLAYTPLTLLPSSARGSYSSTWMSQEVESCYDDTETNIGNGTKAWEKNMDLLGRFTDPSFGAETASASSELDFQVEMRNQESQKQGKGKNGGTRAKKKEKKKTKSIKELGEESDQSQKNCLSSLDGWTVDSSVDAELLFDTSLEMRHDSINKDILQQGITSTSAASENRIQASPLDVYGNLPEKTGNFTQNENKEVRQLNEDNGQPLCPAVSQLMDVEECNSFVGMQQGEEENSDCGSQCSTEKLKRQKQEKLKKLSKPKTEVYKRLAIVKEVLDAKQLRECSFKPAISRKPDLTGHSVPVLDRLMEGHLRIAFRNKARRAIEKEELAACPFRPHINCKSPYYDKSTCQPVEERLQELEKKRRERLERVLKEEEERLTFKPEINEKSIQLVKQKGLGTSDRLCAVASSVHTDCKTDKQDKKATFCPEINRNTDEIIASSKQFGSHCTDFFSRQKQYLLNLEEKRRLKENEVVADLTFMPNIGSSASALKQSLCQSGFFQESDVERVNRLAYEDKLRQIRARQRVSEEYYAQFQFHPEIDEVSRVVGRSASIGELYMNSKGQEVKKELVQAAEEEFNQKYTFRPSIQLPNGESKVQTVQFQGNVLKRSQMKKEKTSLYQGTTRLKEMEEIKECTFKPVINHTRPRETSPVVIKGVERHLELQHVAKQMRKEQEDLAKKIFLSHVSALPSKQYTIPKPFHFQRDHASRYGNKSIVH